MKPFNEIDLIAYHLLELPPRRARALEQALQSDPVLAAESETYAAMLRPFKASPPLNVTAEIVERNWDSISTRLPAYPARPGILVRWLTPALAGVGLAFASTCLFLATHHHTNTHSLPFTPSSTQRAQVAPSPENPAAPKSTTDIGGLQHPRQQPKPANIPPAIPPITGLHQPPPRIIAPLSGNAAPAPGTQSIQLAETSALLLPNPDLPLIATGPEAAVPTSSSTHASKLKHQRTSVHRDHPTDVSLSMGGLLTRTHEISSNGVTHSEGATSAITATAAFHQQLRPAIGYRVALSYARPDFQYATRNGNTSNSQSEIDGRIYELSGTYVLSGPHLGIASTSVEAGAGLMTFSPSVNSSTTGSNLRGAAIVGVGADFAVTKHLAIHTSYRIQVFKGPDFKSSGSVPIVATTLISNEPAVGLTYRFSSR